MTILPYRDRSFARFLSDRTHETLFEITMLDGAIIVWGAHYRPNEFSALLADDGATVRLLGRLHDRCGPVVTFGQHLEVDASFRVQIGVLPANFDPSWSRDRT
jgi:hypothetical protein